MSLESELVEFVKAIPAFYAPIASALAVEMPHLEVLRRLTYDRAPQHAEKPPFIPYLYWMGPYKPDIGQATIGVSGTKKADFWFYVNHKTMTEAMAWVSAIQAAISEKLDTEGRVVLLTQRITAAIFLDYRPMSDPVMRSNQEFAPSQAVIGYTFGYQNIPA